MSWRRFLNTYKDRVQRFFNNNDPDYAAKLLVSANISAFLAWKVVPGFMFNHFVINEVNTIRNHKYYTILTSAFSERQFMPMLFNSITIWFFAKPIAYSIGSGGLYTLYFAGALGNFCGVYYKYKKQYFRRNIPSTTSVQASVAAIMAYFIIRNPWEPILLFFIPMPAIFLGMLMVYLSSHQSEHTALYGGMGGGLFYLLRYLRR
jgi:membrane associated rhomboid family serine protease